MGIPRLLLFAAFTLLAGAMPAQATLARTTPTDLGDPAEVVIGGAISETCLGAADPHRCEVELWNLVHARYQGFSLARFLSPDVAINRGPLTDPQGWNRYAYGANNPLTMVDPDGRQEAKPTERESVIRSFLRAALRKLVSGGGSSGGLDPQNIEAAELVGARGTRSGGNMGGFGGQLLGELTEAGARGIDLAATGAELAGTVQIVSRINQSTALVRHAQGAGSRVQRGLDALVGQLARGNLNPGLGTKTLFGNVRYARGRGGARVFFRVVDGNVQILAKADKSNEDAVIAALKNIYNQ